jgi:hypothetical protein
MRDAERARERITLQYRDKLRSIVPSSNPLTKPQAKWFSGAEQTIPSYRGLRSPHRSVRMHPQRDDLARGQPCKGYMRDVS